jgi:hypothetical protein
MGKRCELKMEHGAFWRRFAGKQSPKDWRPRSSSLGDILAGISEALDLFKSECFAAAQVLGDILMGKRCDLKVDHGAFWRRFAGEQSPEDLETAMQLIHCLFTTSPEPVCEELDTYIQCARASFLQRPSA